MNPVYADDEIYIGTYIQLGRYNDEPIIWRCIDVDDENGILMLSDKILCYKPYDVGEKGEYNEFGFLIDKTKHREIGDGFWEESNIRAWLNAKETGGNIIWPSGSPPSSVWGNGGNNLTYENEDGFISPGNFTESELDVIKSVSQWQILTAKNKDLSTNGIKQVFETNALYYGNGQSDGYNAQYPDVEALSHIEGAMYRLADTIFLPDVRQIYKLWSNFGTVEAFPTEKAFNDAASYSTEFEERKANRYCLRTQSGSGIKYVYGEKGYDAHLAACAYGIRPAFYLNEKNMQILSGSGIESDPYCVDRKFAQESSAVFVNGEQIGFKQEPITENDRIIVPLNEIFEALGAETSYDEGDGVIVATNAEQTVVMQVGNPEMGNGVDVISLDVTPRIIGERIYVPLRAISESFGCEVTYIDNLNRVVIDKPKLPMDFGEGIGCEDWQQPWYKKLYGD